MFENVIRLLICVCGLAILYYIVIWVIGALGIHLPPHVLDILLVVFVLLLILYVYRLFFAGSTWTLFPPNKP